MVSNSDFLWFSLRERRSSLREKDTKLEETSSRRRGFAAAMTQFEEQMAAAKAVTAATRPLNLYYALVQAGYAIQAVYAPNPWSFSRHGLSLDNTATELPDIVVRPDSVGAFQAVAATTGSPVLDSGVSLGALWASLPDIGDAAPLRGTEHPRALRLFVETSPVRAGFGNRCPPPYARVDEPDAIAPSDDAARLRWLEDLIAHYPGAKGAVLRTPIEGAFEIDRKRRSAKIEWPHPNPGNDLSDAELGEFFDQRAPQYLAHNRRFLRPALNGDKPAPSPLMTWWLLLYSFSMLARYRPAEWVALLDTDRSKYSVSLEFFLHTALEDVPHLILEALDREPVLLW